VIAVEKFSKKRWRLGVAPVGKAQKEAFPKKPKKQVSAVGAAQQPEAVRAGEPHQRGAEPNQPGQPDQPARRFGPVRERVRAGAAGLMRARVKICGAAARGGLEGA